MNTDAPIADDSRFLSLSELKQAHTDLRRRFSAAAKSEDAGAAMADEIVRFIERGRATGTMLAEADERWSCQTLLDYWLTKVFDFGRDDVDATLAEFDPETAPDLPDEACPYLGLDAFHEEDSSLFVGRKEFTAQLVSKLGEGGLLLVTGPSGGGKSSAVLAGLIPALKSGALPGSEDWIYCRPIVPGEDPIASLSAVAGAGSTAEGGAPLVIVIDQFEEVFTLCEDVERRRAFSESLLSHVDAGDRIILTIRTDFEPFLGKLPELQAPLKDSKVAITPLSAADLRRAIEEPAEKVGLRFEEGVIERLVDDLVGEPAGLPLLQFTLMMLWKNRTRNRITLDAYEALGGGRLALKRSADKIFDEFIPEEQRTARRIFMKLVKPGEGVEVTRRRVPVGELHSSGEAAERVDRVLARLVDAQLIRKIDGEPGAPAQLEVVHEALVRNWPTLVDWLDEERHALRNLHKMSAAAEIWHNTGKGDEFLYRGEQLSYTEQKLRDSDYELNPREKEFIQASQNLREAEIRKAKRARAVHWMWTIAVTVLSAFALWNWKEAYKRGELLGVANSTLEEQKGTLEEQKAARPWLDNGIRLDDRNLRFEADLVTEANIDAFEIEEQGRSREVINRTGFFPVWQSSLARHHAGGIKVIAASKDGRFLASGGEEGEVKLWDLRTSSEKARVLRGHSGAITSIAFSPDGKILASASQDKTVCLWAVASGDRLGNPIRGNSYPVTCVAFDAAGDRLATSEKFGTINLWKIDASGTTDPVREVSGSFYGSIAALAFSPSGKKLAIGGSAYKMDRSIGEEIACGAIAIWDTESDILKIEPEFKDPPEPKITCLAFGRKDDSLFSGDADGSVKHWQIGEALEAFEVVQVPPTLERGVAVTSLSLGHGGSILASGWTGGTIRLRDVRSGEELGGSFAGHLGAINGLAFGSADEVLVSGGADGTIKRWDPASGEELGSALAGEQPRFGALAMSPDGRILAAGGCGGRIDLWDLATGKKWGTSASLEGHRSGVTRLAFSPTGSMLASGGGDGTIKWWRLNRGEASALIHSIPAAHQGKGGVSGLEFSPDGSHLISSGADRAIRVWDLETKLGSSFPGGEDFKVSCFAASPDGKSVALGGIGGAIKLWVMGRNDVTTLRGHNAAVASLAFAPDGRLLASGAADRTAIIWRLEDRASLLKRFAGYTGPVASVRFSPDGKTFACAAQQEVELWKGADQKEIGAEEIDGEDSSVAGDTAEAEVEWELKLVRVASLSADMSGLSDIAFSPDSRSLVTACHDGFLRLWMIGADEPMRYPGLFNELAYCVAVSADGKLLAAGGEEGALCWDLQTGQEIGYSFEPSPTFGIAFDRDTEWVAGAIDSKDQMWIDQWDIARISAEPQEDAKPSAEKFVEQDGRVDCLASRPAGRKMLASGGDDGLIRLWDEEGQQIGAALEGHTDRVTSLSFDPTGTSLASAGKDGSVWIWEIDDTGLRGSGKRVYSEAEVKIYAVAFDPKSADPELSCGRRLAWGGAWKEQAYSLIIWNLDSGRLEQALPGHDSDIKSIAFHPKLDYVVSGGEDAVVRIWDLDKEKEICWLDEFDDAVSAVAISQDGRQLACASFGQTPVLVWDFASILPIEFDVYTEGASPWLELNQGTHGVRWNASTDSLDHEISFDQVNSPPGSHIGILQRTDFDAGDPTRNKVLINESLFGLFLKSRNWNSALAIYKQLEGSVDAETADRFRKILTEQVAAAADGAPAGAAVSVLNRLQIP